MAEATRRQAAAYLATAAAGLASLGTSYGEGCGGTVEVEGEADLVDGTSDARHFRLRTKASVVSVEVVVEVTSRKGLLDASLHADSASSSGRLSAGTRVRLSVRVPPCPDAQPCDLDSEALARSNAPLDVVLTLRFDQVKGDLTLAYRVTASTEECWGNPFDEESFYLELEEA